MSSISSTAVRITALAVLLGSTALAVPSFASNTLGTSMIVVSQADDDSAPAAPAAKMKVKKGDHVGKMSPEQMKEMVENRITTLHAKLMITPDQESQWSAVAQAMRDSESATSSLVMQRHENAQTMTAVEDLQSYQAIAQSHADGLKNVITAFSALYDSMSDDQKMNADKVFGTFEGHPHGAKTKK
jgi:hypothetical protein